jgi:hypothetical protein
MRARWIRFGVVDGQGFGAACARLAAAQRKGSAPILAWAQTESQYLFALVAPLKRAPGRATRWLSWGVTAAIATYRQFGYAAYLDGESVCLYGRKIGDIVARPIGECVVVASSFLLRFPEACVITPSAELEQAFRLRLEAQHGWQFDHSWPTAPETARYAHA